MRALQGIVGCEVLVLIALLALELAPDPVAPPRPGSASDGAATQVAAAASGGVAGEAEFAPSSAPSRERVDAAPAGAGDIVLQGRLLGWENLRDPNVNLSCRRDGALRPAVEHDGRYAIAGLEPGVWRVVCIGRGVRKLEFDHTITEQPVQRLDLELEPALVLPVFLRTTAGARLGAELARLGLAHALRVAAVELPLAQDLDPVVWSGGLGVGRYYAVSGSDLGVDGPDGHLELDRPPPLHAALLLQHAVLAQQPLVPGQRELTFTLDLAAVTARLSTLRVRFVDTNGLPVDAGVLIGNSPRFRMDTPAEDGTHVVENLLPGITQIVAEPDGLEPFREWTMLAPGATTDLGEIVLQGEVEVRGRVVDAHGNGTAAQLECTPLDRWRPPLPMHDHPYITAAGDGDFTMLLGPRRYLLCAKTPDGRIGRTIADGRGGSMPPITLTVASPTDVVFRTDQRLAAFAVVVRTEAGEPIAVVRLEPVWRDRTLKLLPGDHSLDIHDGNGALLRRMPLRVGTERLLVEVP